MTFLTRMYRLTTCLRYTSAVNNFPVNVPRVLHNRQTQYNLTCKFYSLKTQSSAKAITFDEKVKKYLDYLMNANVQNKVENSIVKEFLDIREIEVLLNERLELISAIEGCNAERDNKSKKESTEDEVLFEKLRLKEVDDELVDIVLRNLHGSNFANVVIQISAGVGGQEAMLFVKDLCNLYINYFNYLDAEYEIFESGGTGQGGYRSISMYVRSKDIFRKVQYEGGVHRVQRIPETESHGRIHTSVASVAVLPQPSEIDISLKPTDLIIQTKKASGAGGQHVNTTDSAVRIVHKPTGIATECQEGRSQHKNKEIALMKLRNILYENALNEQNTFISKLRKRQFGMGRRNEKIRTYNYHQNRVTDHRLSKGTINNLKGFMEGGEALEKLEERLHEDMQKKLLLEVIEKTIGN